MPVIDALPSSYRAPRDRLALACTHTSVVTPPCARQTTAASCRSSGQSELGRALAGLLTPDSGSVHVGEQDLTGASPKRVTAAGVGIVPEDRHAVGCITGLSIAENMFLGRLGGFSRFGLINRPKLHAASAELMTRFDGRAPGPQTLFGALSGGNQQKAVLARELTLEPLVLLIAAQPPRGLDVGAVEAVHTQSKNACAGGVGVLLISSELDELIAVSDRIRVIYRGKVLKIPGLSELPFVGTALSQQVWLVYFAFALALGVYLFLRHTALGLAVRAAGADPRAADKAGLSVARTRYFGVVCAGVFVPIDRRHPHLHRGHDQRRRLPCHRRHDLRLVEALAHPRRLPAVRCRDGAAVPVAGHGSRGADGAADHAALPDGAARRRRPDRPADAPGLSGRRLRSRGSRSVVLLARDLGL